MSPKFKDNAAALAAADQFIEITIDCAKVFASWRGSIYSFEWIDADGNVKKIKDLGDAEGQKRQIIEDALNKNEPIEKAVLGFGMLDCIEIGSGRAAFLTLYDMGLKTMPAHISKNAKKDFENFLAK